MPQDNSSKLTVFITGATSGIGLSLARLFAQDKHNLFLVARDREKLVAVQNTLEKEFHISVGVAVGDLTDEVFRLSLPVLVSGQGYTVQCLVNNAGNGVEGPFHETSWEKEQNSLFLNALAPTHLSKIFLADLIKTKGSILNIASTASFMPGPFMSVYFATKAFIFSFSESLRLELQSYGVGVTVLLPGPTVSGFQKANNMEELSLGRYPSAETVALYGYKALQKNKAVAIHGFKNKLCYCAIKFVPRFVTRFFAFQYMRPRSSRQ